MFCTANSVVWFLLCIVELNTTFVDWKINLMQQFDRENLSVSVEAFLEVSYNIVMESSVYVYMKCAPRYNRAITKKRWYSVNSFTFESWRAQYFNLGSSVKLFPSPFFVCHLALQNTSTLMLHLHVGFKFALDMLLISFSDERRQRSNITKEPSSQTLLSSLVFNHKKA